LREEKKKKKRKPKAAGDDTPQTSYGSHQKDRSMN
jgi:hypothetical protein